jgi:hypothetical protein
MLASARDGLLLLKKRKAKRTCQGTESDHVKHAASSTRVLIQHTVSVNEVMLAFVTSRPIFSASGWRFRETVSAVEFWTAVKNEHVYQVPDEILRLKSAKKTLNAFGYDVTHSQESWLEGLSWGWDCVRAIKNCYWLNTTVSLNWKVKKMLKIVSKHYRELGVATQVNNFTVFFHFFMGMSKSVFSICLG